MPTAAERDIPGVIFPPPLIYLGTIVVGLTLDAFLPLSWPWPAPPVSTVIGVVLIAAAVPLLLWQFATFARAGTPVPTRSPTTALALDGPYRFSRNPVYVAMTLFVLGLAFAFGGWGTVLALIPTLLLIRYGVIAREERYLTRKFGQAYTDYTSRVRRWI